MGLGKTLQMLSLCTMSGGPTLVVGPLSVLSVWEKETHNFRANVLGSVIQWHGAAKKKHGPAELQAAGVVVTTYDTMKRNADELARVRWKRLVADEAQNVKNDATMAHSALMKIARSAQHRFAPVLDVSVWLCECFS